MVLHDVAHRTDAVVVTGALFDPERLRSGDLDVVDVLARPDGLEDAVREAQHEDVLHRFLAQVVIDAEHLVFAEDLLNDARELHRALEIVAIRLLHDDARPSALAAQAVGTDRAEDRLVGGWRRREIEEAIPVRADLPIGAGEQLSQLVVAAVVGGRDVVDGTRERRPDLFVDRPGAAEFRDGIVQLRAEGVRRHLAARGSDDREARRQQMLER